MLHRMRLSVCAAAFLLFFLAAAPAAYADHAININTADRDTLSRDLLGIGDSKAQAIIDYRNGPNGPFETIEEIMHVSGIKQATFDNIKDHITISGGAAHSENAAESGSNASAAGESENISSNSEEARLETGTGASSASSGTPGAAVIPDPDALFLDIGGGTRTVFVGEDSVFEARLVGWRGTPLAHARITWSFGNGALADGYAARYRFLFPGSYAVVADAVYGDTRTNARTIVSAIPPPITITAVTDEYIALKNEGKGDVDIGGWFLFSAGKQFLFPKYTVMLPGASVMVPHAYSELSGESPDTVALQFPNGTVAASFFSPPPTPPRRAAVSDQTTAVRQDAPLIATQDMITAPIVAAGSAAPFGNALPSITLWFFALAVLIGSAASGVVFVRSNARRQGYVVQEIHE